MLSQSPASGHYGRASQGHHRAQNTQGNMFWLYLPQGGTSHVRTRWTVTFDRHSGSINEPTQHSGIPPITRDNEPRSIDICTFAHVSAHVLSICALTHNMW
jgi:hypothetical protein